MKKLYFIFALIISSLVFAQVPQGFSYQTIAFNASGAPIANGNISLKISILDQSATGTELYSETHAKTTNAKGLVNLNIGEGTPVSGTFSSIDWSTNSKFIKVEMDPAGGTNYTNVGVNQLMSVPYAQVSETVVTKAGQGITLTSPNGTKYTLSVDDTGILNLPSSSEPQNYPTYLFMYGNYNNWDPVASDQLINVDAYTRYIYKYLSSTSKIKFISAQNTNGQIYGSDGFNTLVLNGDEYSISNSGFYRIELNRSSPDSQFGLSIESVYPYIRFTEGYTNPTVNPTYDINTGTFNFVINNVKSSTNNKFKFIFRNFAYGDNLKDGSWDEYDYNNDIIIPNTTSTAKNYQVDLKINSDGTGTYTITDLSASTVPTTGYIVGSFNSWDATTALQMTQVSPGIFQSNYTFSGGAQVKILPEKNWNTSYGGENQVLTLSGANIVVPNSAILNVNFNTMTYYFTY